MPGLTLHRDGAAAWRLTVAPSGLVVGGIRYEHARDGNHYRTWLYTAGEACDFGEPLPQLAMAARAVETEVAAIAARNRSSSGPDTA
jgi:hypothetical protein